MRRSWRPFEPVATATLPALPAIAAAPADVVARRRSSLRRWLGLVGVISSPGTVSSPPQLETALERATVTQSLPLSLDATPPPDPIGQTEIPRPATPTLAEGYSLEALPWLLATWIGLLRGLIRCLRRSIASLRRDRRRIEKLHGELEAADRYSDWYHIANQLDDLEYNTDWKTASSFQSDCELCDIPLLRARLREMSRMHTAGDYRNLVFSLRAGLLRNFAGIDSPRLHAHSHVGTKVDVEDYVHVVSYFLECIAASPVRADDSLTSDGMHASTASSNLSVVVPSPSATASRLLSSHDKLSFLNEARHAYGRTALVLSGGFLLGLDHLGAVRSLLVQELLPRVVVGFAAGAVVAGYVGAMTATELRIKVGVGRGSGVDCGFHDSAHVVDKLLRLLRDGVVNDVSVVQERLRRALGDLTFEEAHSRTKRILNIIVTPGGPGVSLTQRDPPILLNYLTAPNVVIWSAVAASAALPVLYAPVELVAKDIEGKLVPHEIDGVRWFDGSPHGTIPLSRVSELFNVNHFIVSRMSTHLMPRGRIFLHSRLARLLRGERRFRYAQLLQWNLAPRLLASVFPALDVAGHGIVPITSLIHVGDLLGVFRAPRADEARAIVARGEKYAFPKLDQILHRCLIELTLEWCLERVADSASRARPRRRLRLGRVPSWLWHDSGVAHGTGGSGDFSRGSLVSPGAAGGKPAGEDFSDASGQDGGNATEDDETDDVDERLMC